jgi:hypothetical protein
MATTETIECPLCKNKAPMEIVCDQIVGSEEDTFYDAVVTSQYWQLLKCFSCYKPILRESWHHELLDDPTSITSERYKIVYPFQNIQQKPLPAFSHLPKSIENLYTESIYAYNNNCHFLCAMGLRTLIESVCKDQKISANANVSTDLEGKIGGLFELGKISDEQKSVLHELRSIGNEATHDFVSPALSTLDASFNVIDLLLRNIYELPIEAGKIKSNKTEKKNE